MPRASNSAYHDSVAPLKPWLNDKVRVDPTEARELKRAALAGDDQAREKLVKAALPYALKLARQFHHRTGFNLDDCLSCAGFGAVEGVRRFDPDRGSLLNIVGLVVKHQLITEARKAVRNPEPIGDAVNDVADEGAERRTRAEQVQAALSELPPRLQYIAERHHIDGQTYAEIGRGMGLSRERVRQLALRADRWLKRLLAERVEGVE